MKKQVKGGNTQMNAFLKSLFCKAKVLTDIVSYNKDRKSYYNFCSQNGIKFY